LRRRRLGYLPGIVTADGIDLLREKRGDQPVTFSDVCDHLVDFRRRSPEHGVAIEAFATFLANVEDVSHGHEDGRGGTLASDEARDVPA
jgi:uncharacterized protein DUF6104